MKLVIAGLLLVLCMNSLLEPATALADQAKVHPSLCGSRCGGRCSRAAYNDRCMKYCNICCQKCQCVPSGTHGNKHECPCYRDMVNNKGTPKCP